MRISDWSSDVCSSDLLPFADDSFDVVLSNHVIEHVGEQPEQLAHLSELRRVLTPGGIGYLAVPNRWMLVEPHYRLAFLSWWPHRSEEHTSELTSLMRTSYAVFCLKKNT